MERSVDIRDEEKLLQDAARHAARQWSGAQTEQERAALQAWLARDPAHADAFAAAQLLADGVAELGRCDPEMARLVAQAEQPVGGAHRRLARTTWTLVALAACAAVVAAVQWRPALGGADPQTTYAATDAPRRIDLPDGSRIDLDVGTRVQVDYSRSERRIALLAGRALFAVAHDRDRPFEVDADGYRTVALGTRFQVDRRDALIAVTLSEGSVRVESGVGSAATAQRLRPGERLLLPLDGRTAWHRERADVDVATSWSRGRLLFRDTPLAEAVHEINRYARIPVVLAEPGLSTLRISGNFQANDSDTTVAAFASILPIRTVREKDRILILERTRMR
ncbi:DUF4974 domain-containing protein [Pseudoxanthomonas winnipegensis]|nr:DUF4974 domain-containing protein [Pseudoxanthomonas winnipegensis]